MNENIYLRRRAAAKALTEAGFPMSPATLATQATRGNGPPYRLFGRIPLYSLAETLAWAELRLTPPVKSTAELDAAGCSPQKTK
jgi:hypothetical protein